MSIPKEPRQLMINLMYLVLTAMLALNVSNEILNAFKIINRSITNSNAAVEQKNVDVMGQFQANMDLPDQKARIEQYYMKAQQVRKQSQELYAYMEDWKRRVIMQGGGYAHGPDADTTLPEKEDNIDAGTFLLYEHRGGDTVKQRLQAFRNFVLSQVNAEGKAALSKTLAVRIDTPKVTEHNPNGDWAYEMFHYVPSTAVMTLFSKLQNDIRVSESQVLDRLFTEANAKTLKFDAITAIAVPQTSYAMVGQPIEAKIMFAAYNSSVTPEIRPSSGSVVVKDGVGTWKGTAGGTGLQTVRGTLKLDVMGMPQEQKWEFSYMVGSTGASIQLDKMNVFYIGVVNPISISAAGYNIEDVDVVVPAGCTKRKTGPGKYDIEATTPGTFVAKVIGTKDGQQKEISSTTIRIKELPTPRAAIARKYGGAIGSGVIKAQSGIEAFLEGFDFEARFTVVSYKISTKRKGGNVSGDTQVNSPYFTDEVREILRPLAPGDKVFFDDIRAVGPDKKIRNLGTLSFTLI